MCLVTFEVMQLICSDHASVFSINTPKNFEELTFSRTKLSIIADGEVVFNFDEVKTSMKPNTNV